MIEMSLIRNLIHKIELIYPQGFFNCSQRFSPCSLRSIRKVLQAKSGRCFSEPEESFCGNLRVEGGEECDAGLLGEKHD